MIVDEGVDPVPPITFTQEVKDIKTIFKKTQMNIKFKAMQATRQNFYKMINQAPTILHIACHGFADLKSKKPNPFLLLENEDGTSHKLRMNEFQEVMKQTFKDEMPRDLDLCYISACQSQDIAI
jgi:CHAT domain-containing protein